MGTVGARKDTERQLRTGRESLRVERQGSSWTGAAVSGQAAEARRGTTGTGRELRGSNGVARIGGAKLGRTCRGSNGVVSEAGQGSDGYGVPWQLWNGRAR